MNTHRYSSSIAAFLLTCAMASCNGGEDGATGSTDDTHHHESVTIWTDSLELFFEHAPLIAGGPYEPWAVHLTDLRTGKPVSEGALTLLLITPDGGEITVREDGPTRPGVYEPTPELTTGGMHDLVVEISGAQLTTEVFVGPMLVYGSAAEVPLLEPEPEVGIAFLKEQQWAIDFGVEEAKTGSVPHSIGATGEVTPQSGRLAEVNAPVDGLMLAEDNRSAPVPGEWVNEGETLAVLSPVGGADAYAQLVAREQRLAREVERAERLYGLEAIPQRRLEDARRDLAVSRAALTAMGADPGSGYALSLRAPISGVIDLRQMAMGQRVAAGELLYSIVDPRTVWLRLDISAHHAAELGSASAATFQVEGSERIYRSTRMVSVGEVIDRTKRTLPVTLEVTNSDQSLRIGMLAEGRLLLGDPQEGVAIPTAAVRDEDGVQVAYVQISGESFERRALALGPSDGEWTIVEAGIRPGERVVTRGAYQVKLATLNTTEFPDHGHAH